MDRDVFVSCFAAIALALLIYAIANYFTIAPIAGLIVVLVAIVIVFATQPGALQLSTKRKR